MDNQTQLEEPINVLGEPLEPCGLAPITGFFRDGACNTAEFDYGSHTVCALMTTEFLEFSRFRGNDLSTPRPEFGFAGLKAGDSWCLCAARWLEAYHGKRAPKVNLRRTHIKALETIPLELLKEYAADLN